MVHGYRPVDPNVQCSSLADRTVANCSTPGFQTFEFNHKGLQRFGQFLVPGVDPAITAGTGVSPNYACLLYTSPSPRDPIGSRMPSSA